MQPEVAPINYEKEKNRKMLSKDAKNCFCTPYIRNIYRVANREFQNRKPKNFDSAQHIHSTFFSDWSLENIEDTLRELGRNKIFKQLLCRSNNLSLRII